MPAAERLAGPYGIYGQNLPDHEQAFAAAGLSLLLGYADPGRPLNSIEQGSARDAGLQLLGKAVEGPRLAFGNLAGQDSLAGGIQAGSARQSFDSATITAPGPAAADLPQRAQRQIDASRQQLAAAPGTVHSTYERFQHDVKAAGSGPIEAMTQHKLDWYRDQMHSALNDPRSAGQLAAEEVGGAFMHHVVTGLSATGSALSSAVDTIVTTYNELRAKGASPQDAMMAGLNAAGDAADRVLQGYYDSRFQQARSLGLPDNLANLYAQSNLTALQQTIPGLAKYLPGHDLNPTLQSSLQELQGDPNAQQVVDLVQRAGRTSNDHYLHLAGDYLQTRQSAQTFWQSLPVKSGVPLSLDLPPVPSHLADYEATANRLLDRLVTAESNGRHYGNNGSLLESTRGAQGITQVMPATGKDPGFGVTPVQNASRQEYLRFGRDYLTAMLNEFNGDPRKALAAYNWGPGYVQDVVQQRGAGWEGALPQETKEYLQRILGRSIAG